MALIVEDGTIVDDAEAWTSVEFADIYLGALGDIEWVNDDIAKKEAAIRRGTASIVLRNEGKWKGLRSAGRGQPLPWPRVGATDAEDNPIDDDEIPIELIRAGAEAAARERREPGALLPDYIDGEKIESFSAGPISIQFGEGSVIPNVSAIDDLLAGFLDKAKSSGTLYLERA